MYLGCSCIILINPSTPSSPKRDTLRLISRLSVPNRLPPRRLPHNLLLDQHTLIESRVYRHIPCMAVYILLISYKCKLTAHQARRMRAHTAAAFCLVPSLLTSNFYLGNSPYHPNRHLLHACSGAIQLRSSCHWWRAIPRRRRGLFVRTVLDANASTEGSNISMS